MAEVGCWSGQEKKHQQRQPESAEPHRWKHAENDKGTIDAGIEQQQEEIFVIPAAPRDPRVPRLQDLQDADPPYVLKLSP